MPELRKFVTWLFALEAFLWAPVSLLAAWVSVRLVSARTIATTGRGTASELAAFSVIAALAPLFAVAWWTTWRRKAGGRAVALVASGVNVLLGIAPRVVPELPHVANAKARLVPTHPIWELTAFGLAGLACFWNRNAASSVGGEDRLPRSAPPNETPSGPS